MALLYEGEYGPSDRYQVARREDGVWFKRWVLGGNPKQWRETKDPAPHYGIVSDATGPNDIITELAGRNFRLVLRRAIQPDLPLSTL